MSKSLLQRLELFGEKPGLERIEFLLNALDNPHRAFPAVHVAGTNGKGSTSAMVASILRAAGLRVGLFTSPHLVRYNERIVVDGQPISDDDLTALMNELESHVQRAAEQPEVGQPTEFEVATAAAMAHFARAGVDVAVVEVGLGGRFDSTNAVRPVVSVITPIGLDHTNRLGTTMGQIASDKAGIIRPGVPVISAPQHPEAADVIAAEAAARGAPLFTAGRDFEGKLVRADKRGTAFDVRWKDAWVRGLHVPLLGPHQSVNGATAVAACFVWRDMHAEADLDAMGDGRGGHIPANVGPEQSRVQPSVVAARTKLGEALSEEAVRAGLREVRWPGRLEVMGSAPTVILDGAHNAEAADVLATTLNTVFPAERPVFVMGILGEKPVDRILETLLPLGRAVVFTAPRSSRTPPADPVELARRAAGLVETIEVEPVAEKAVARARALAGRDGIVCVCGSLYLVGEVRGLSAGECSPVRE